MKKTEEAKAIALTRKDLYTSKDVLQMNSTVRMAKDSTLPFLNTKQIWLVSHLLNNDIAKNYVYTLDSLSNDYRKVCFNKSFEKAKDKVHFADKYRKSFKSGEIVTLADIKAAIQYIYFANNRLFEYYRNAKQNYCLHEIEYMKNLASLKERKIKK